MCDALAKELEELPPKEKRKAKKDDKYKIKPNPIIENPKMIVTLLT